MAYTLNWKDSIAIYEFSGEMTDQDMYDSNRQVLDSEYFPQMRGQLIDQLNVTSSSVSTKCIQTIAKWDSDASKLNPTVKIAVITKQPSQFGLTRMYELSSLESKWETRIFDNIAAAKAWLM